MLTISGRALNVIRRVSTNSKLQPAAGLRLAARGEPAAPLAVRAVDGPGPGDRVVERGGGRLYLDHTASRRVADRELDAETDSEGRVQFVIKDPA